MGREREGERERERERERHQFVVPLICAFIVASHVCPNWGPNL